MGVGGGGGGGHFTASCPFALTRSRHSRADGGCPVATGVIFCPDPSPNPPPKQPSNCFRHSRWRRAATFNQNPKIAPVVSWVGGWVGSAGSGPPAGSTGVMCSSLSSRHTTARGDIRPDSRPHPASFASPAGASACRLCCCTAEGVVSVFGHVRCCCSKLRKATL